MKSIGGFLEDVSGLTELTRAVDNLDMDDWSDDDGDDF